MRRQKIHDKHPVSSGHEGEPLALHTALSESHTMLISLVVGALVVMGLYRWPGKRSKQVTG